jgi:hypothetical protein
MDASLVGRWRAPAPHRFQGTSGGKTSDRTSAAAWAFREGIRSVASITICGPSPIALYSIDYTAITTYAAMTEN